MTGTVLVRKSGCKGGGGWKRRKGDDEAENQLSLVALLVAAIRRSMVSCRVDQRDEVASTVQQMEIGWPTNVQHVAHVTFDRFHGFLGLPVEFEREVPGKVPSASTSVFGVSPESMQCCYDSTGNSVPTILLLMQERLYSQGGLKAEGIFRINPENSQEEHVRDQLNKGIVPDDIDVHCLAGLIKAWFRELPEGILDGLSPEQVLQCNTEEESTELVKLLLPTQAAILNWAIDLMADVVEEEEANKMNARNIAMVFAPNMTQMADPLTALMHAVQVMNLLKTLILKTLREREEAAMEEEGSWPCPSPSSDQQTDEELDSQQEGDMCSELREHNWDGDNPNYSQSTGDETESLNEIEECLLRQLDGKEEVINDDHETLAGNIDRDYTSRSSLSGNQAMQGNGSDLNTESSLSISDSKVESLSTTSDGEDSGISVVTKDLADASTKIPLEGCGNCSNAKMVEVQEESLNGLLPCLH